MRLFTIVNCNHYTPLGVDPYDEYSLVYNHTVHKKLGKYSHKILVLRELQYTIHEDIGEHITIAPISFTADQDLGFGLYVMEAERSALIKLTYS